MANDYTKSEPSIYSTTISDITGNRYNELRFSAASDTLIEGKFVADICLYLRKCGIDINDTNVYNENVSNKVAEFQEKVGLSKTGILNNATLSSMLYYAKQMDDNVQESTDIGDGTNTVSSNSPHYNSFFDTDKLKIHRLNHKDIKIVLGNNSIVKTIKDVFMRSVSVEVDTSGNPISEVYEFVARDIQESDEVSDTAKYISEEPSASSDVKYIYNFQMNS